MIRRNAVHWGGFLEELIPKIARGKDVLGRDCCIFKGMSGRGLYVHVLVCYFRHLSHLSVSLTDYLFS